MSQHYTVHAHKIVDDFQKLIGPEARSALTQEHLDELSLLIEAAISTSVLEEMERAADLLSAAAARLRQKAERFDN